MPLTENPECHNVNVSKECWVFVHRTGSVSTHIDLGDLYVSINQNDIDDDMVFTAYAAETVELRGNVNFREDDTTSLTPWRGSRWPNVNPVQH